MLNLNQIRQALCGRLQMHLIYQAQMYVCINSKYMHTLFESNQDRNKILPS